MSEADALNYVAGYSTGNDFSARDLQMLTSQFMIGKTHDGFAPLGPYMVTSDLIPDPNNLRLETRVNGETRQDWNTNDMIFNCRQLISFASKMMTIKPGDIFFTGTPQGVILGMPPDKRVWLKAGDKVACSLEKLGELQVRADSSSTASPDGAVFVREGSRGILEPGEMRPTWARGSGTSTARPRTRRWCMSPSTVAGLPSGASR